MFRSQRDRARRSLVLTSTLMLLAGLTACESSNPPATGGPTESVEGACVSSDECLLLPPPSDCNGDWFCEEGLCEHHCSLNSCETASDCTIAERCEDGHCVPDVEDNPEVVCFETGCSGEFCSAEPVDSTCAERIEFECLVLTTCGTFGPNGGCGWEQNDAYLGCLEALEPPVDPCAEVDCAQGETCVDGVCKPVDPCAGVQCGEEATCVDGKCVPIESPGCDSDADCDEGEACVEGACTGGAGEDKCYVSGCSGEICSSEFMVSSDCTWLPEFDCLVFTLCGAYGEDGGCGWEQNPEYLDCLQNVKPPVEGCSSNEDCAPEEICLEGVCAAKPPLPPGMCTSSADCKAGAQCIDGLCVGGPGGACQVTGCSG
ncbi:MAG: hypothetical protein VX938_05355, partial [Myxococcota bacterium]|nr:hypothetical protein [Myxococcota bacterium]